MTTTKPCPPWCGVNHHEAAMYDLESGICCHWSLPGTVRRDGELIALVQLCETDELSTGERSVTGLVVEVDAPLTVPESLALARRIVDLTGHTLVGGGVS